MAKALTERDKQVFEYIKERIEDGYAPTVREICAAIGLNSTSTGFRCINNLVDAGLLEKSENQNRAIKLAGKGGVRVPVIGTVTAGVPITAIENVTDFISFKTSKHYDNPLFALKVRGESMINAAILDGDTVIVEQQPVASNGDIVVALIDNIDATVKTFYKENGHFRLQPENDTMEPIIVDEVKILGRVIAVMRYYE
ncbi:MAG: transcriptional repressor LexA [Ruminococcus sp.]|nr:transcriptional repressor LexA [Ruminococcus sp.]